MPVNMLIALFVVAAAIAVLYFIYRLRQRKTRLRELASDFGQDNLKSGTTYEGEQNGHKFYYEYFSGSKNRPSCLRIWLDCPSQGGFRITSEGRLDGFFKRLGITEEIQTGDVEFDRLFFIRTDHVASTRVYLDVPETREAVKSIHRQGFGEISHDGNIMQAKISPFTASESQVAFNHGAVVDDLLQLTRRIPEQTQEPRFAGMAGWKFRRNAVYAVNAVVAAGGMGLMFWGLSSYTPLHAFEVFTYSTKFSIPALLLCGVIMVYMLKGRSSSHTDLLINLAIAAIGLPLAAFGSATVVNGRLDDASTQYHDSEVIGKRYSTSRDSKNYYVALKSWNPDRSEEEIRVTASLYRRVKAGETVMTIGTRPGYLGFEWIVDYGIKPPSRKP